MKLLIRFDEDEDYRYFDYVKELQVYHDRIEFGNEYFYYDQIFDIRFITDTPREERQLKKLIEYVKHKVVVTPHRRSVNWVKEHLIETLWVMKWVEKVQLPIDPFWCHSVPTKNIMSFMNTPKNHMYKDMDWDAFMESDDIYPCKFLGQGLHYNDLHFCYNKECEYKDGTWSSNKCVSEEMVAFDKMFDLIKKPRPYNEVVKFKELLYIKYMEKEYNVQKTNE